jgi:hypothetical protein
MKTARNSWQTSHISIYLLFLENAMFSMGIILDPKMEVLYNIFGHILWGYSLT